MSELHAAQDRYRRARQNVEDIVARWEVVQAEWFARIEADRTELADAYTRLLAARSAAGLPPLAVATAKDAILCGGRLGPEFDPLNQMVA